MTVKFEESPESRRRWAKFKQEIEDLGVKSVDVGYPKNSGTHSKSGADMAQHAGWHEYGTSDGRIPARPFMTQFANVQQRKVSALITKEVQDFVDDVVRGNPDVDQLLDSMGNEVADLLKKWILEEKGSYEPLDGATITNKGGDDSILVDTDEMAEAATYQVVRKKIR